MEKYPSNSEEYLECFFASPVRTFSRFLETGNFQNVKKTLDFEPIRFKELLFDSIKKELENTGRKETIYSFNIDIEEVADAMIYIISNPNGGDEYTKNWGIIINAKNLFYYLSDKIENNAVLALVVEICDKLNSLFFKENLTSKI